MADSDWLAAAFEEHREHLRAVAYRLFGSMSDADDAVQDTWLRVAGADTSEVANPGGWLTTVVARVSLNMLRSRRRRPEQPVGDAWPAPVAASARAGAMAGSPGAGPAAAFLARPVASGRRTVLHGAEVVASGAVAAAARAEESRLALVDGAVGIIFAPAGHLRIVLALTVSNAGRITAIDVIADPDRPPGVPGHGVRGLAPGEAECSPRASRAPGDFPEVWEVRADR